MTATVDPAGSDVFTLHPGRTPLLVSLPHVGTHIPQALRERFVPRALALEDTDWHLEALYSFVRELGGAMIVPRHSRYVIDLNRPPANTPMYPGVNNTELCPTRFFSGEPLYREGQAPDETEIRGRIERYWRPYHDALRAEMERLKAAHGHVVLWDGHSIRSTLPWLFEGRLPDLNLGTAGGASCDPALRARLMRVLDAQVEFSHVTDGRFKGGYITREYGRPEAAMHAVQLEMCWSCYMAEAAPYEVEQARSQRLAPLLRRLLETSAGWRPGA